MTAGRIIVHVVSPAAISREAALECLTDEEIARAGRFYFEKDAMHWMACRSHLRSILGEAIQRPPHEVPLSLSEYGKPSLAPPFQSLHFNLSHCRDLAVIALTFDGPVGIDLEALGRATDLQECETTFCHPDEILGLPAGNEHRARQLLRIWTAKEAVLKAMGTGLSHPPESTRIVFGQPGGFAVADPPLAGIEHLRLHELLDSKLTGYQAFVAAPATATHVQII
jgi:4'-phosphopantetheinyl transferase